MNLKRVNIRVRRVFTALYAEDNQYNISVLDDDSYTHSMTVRCTAQTLVVGAQYLVLMPDVPSYAILRQRGITPNIEVIA